MGRSRMRGKGEGSVYQRADGYWVASVEAGICRGAHDRRDGTRCGGGERRKLRAVRRYKADAVAELADLARQATGDGVVPDRTTTVAKFVTWWLDTVKAPDLQPSSLRQYRAYVEPIVRFLGSHKLYRLARGHVQAMLAELEREGASAATRAAVLGRILKPALGYAVDSEMVPRNVAAGVQVAVKYVPKTDDTPEVAEVKAILQAAEGDRLYPMVFLALKYGLRLGELLNLSWTDIDLAAGELTVRRSKTDAGLRTLPLLPDALKVLKAHRKAQAAERVQAPGWPAGDAVFTGSYYGQPGHALSPEQARKAWHAVCERAKVSRRRFHSSRHAAATMMLEDGVELPIISAILGHANVGVTSTVYARVRKDLLRKGLRATG